MNDNLRGVLAAFLIALLFFFFLAKANACVKL